MWLGLVSVMNDLFPTEERKSPPRLDNEPITIYIAIDTIIIKSWYIWQTNQYDPLPVTSFSLELRPLSRDGRQNEQCPLNLEISLLFGWFCFKMVVACCAVGCMNRQECKPNFSFYFITFNEQRWRRWIAAVNHKDFSALGEIADLRRILFTR